MSQPRLVDLPIQPGLYTDETGLGARPYWKDGDRVRFRNGLAEQIGGWIGLPDADGVPITVAGIPRAIHDWSSLDNQAWIAIGTHLKLLVINSGHVYDITPLRDSGRLTDAFTVTAGSATLTVHHVAHGVDDGDFVHFAGADAVGGVSVDGEHRVTRVIDAETFEVTLADAATASASGGGSIDYEYEIHIGHGHREKVYGYGVGGYGRGTYGTPRAESTLYAGMRIWSLDNWGEDLIACPFEGAIYVWDRSAGPGQRAYLIDGAPIANRWIAVSPEDRHLVAFGAHTGASPDAMLVRWSDQENYNQFLPTTENTAGDKRLDAGSAIVTAIDTRGEKLIFTDEALYSMTFIGGFDVFGFTPRGASVTIVGANAAAQVNGVVYFMGTQDFFVYDGVLRTLACGVRNRVFDDFNSEQGASAYAVVNRLFTEIMWVYASADALDNDRYVTYNYRENLWYFGSLERTAAHDQSSAYGLPYGASSDGALYLHETGHTADGAPLASFIESYDQQIGEGDALMHVHRLVPDFLYLEGTVNVTLASRRYPQAAAQALAGPYACRADTAQLSVRARNRQIALRIEAPETDTRWRMGNWRAEVRPHGRR